MAAPIRNIFLHHTDRLNNYLQTEDNGTTFGIRILCPTAECYRKFFEVEDWDRPKDAEEAYVVYVMFTMGGIDIPPRCYNFFPRGRAPNMPTRRVVSIFPIAERHAQIVRFGHLRDQHYNMQGQNGCVMGMFSHAMDRQLGVQVGLPGPGTVLPPPPDPTVLQAQITQLQGQVQATQDQLNTANANLHNVTQERNTARNQVNAVTQERDTAQNDLHTANGRITQLTNDLQAATNQIAAVTNERNAVTQERDTLRAQITPNRAGGAPPDDDEGAGGAGAQQHLPFDA